MRLHAALIAATALTTGCDSLRATVVENYPSDYEVEDASGGAQAASRGLAPTFDGADAGRAQAPIRLVPVVTGLQEPTDLSFVPGRTDRLVVLEKGGKLNVFDVTTGAREATPLALDVLTKSEQGLLGIAFHPDFAENQRFYLNAVMDTPRGAVTRVSEHVDAWSPRDARVLLEAPQPYANHNAGQLAFGPDGLLYIGLGDGGWRDDPKGHGQNRSTWLGSMLRIDVDARTGDREYGIPADNPYVADPAVPDEIWATGLRNPWRYSFDPQGRLIVADVGQNAWEEVSIVSKGDNLGWNLREGRSCFPADATACPSPAESGLQDPIYAYPHQEGQSITGGFVYTGAAMPTLAGQYVFADFVSGRFWAIPLPAGDVPLAPPAVTATALGRFAVLPSSFARGPEGELYVADYKGGVVYKLVPDA